MIGTIAGDIIGSVQEANPSKTTVFPMFIELYGLRNQATPCFLSILDEFPKKYQSSR